MSRARHGKTCKASGGAMKVAGNPNVFKEAAEKHAKGGKVGKKAMMAEGMKSKHRMDKPRRASGGGVGADRHPFSSAHKSGRAEGVN